MKRYYASIAPGYGEHISLTDGKHGCNVEAENIEEAKEKIVSRAKEEEWAQGHIKLDELDSRGSIINRGNPLAAGDSVVFEINNEA